MNTMKIAYSITAMLWFAVLLPGEASADFAKAMGERIMRQTFDDRNQDCEYLDEYRVEAKEKCEKFPRENFKRECIEGVYKIYEQIWFEECVDDCACREKGDHIAEAIAMELCNLALPCRCRPSVPNRCYDISKTTCERTVRDKIADLIAMGDCVDDDGDPITDLFEFDVSLYWEILEECEERVRDRIVKRS